MRSAPRLLLALTLTLGTAGCTLVGRPRAGAPAPPGAASPAGQPPSAESGQERWGGQVDLENQKLVMVLDLEARSGEQVEAEVRIADLNLTAKGGGTRKDGVLDLQLAYPGTCPGTMKIQVRPGDRDGTLVGTLEASDCTGTERGTVRLLKRTEASPG